MAKKSKTETVETISASRKAFDAFSGHTVVDQLDGTWHKEPGEALVGTISHAYTYRAKRPDASGERRECTGLAIRTTAPCLVSQDGDVTEFEPGALIGITLNEKLMPLLDYAPGSDVAILAVREVALGGRQSTWEYKVRASGKKNPRGSSLRSTAVVDAPDAAEIEVEPENVVEADFIQ